MMHCSTHVAIDHHRRLGGQKNFLQHLYQGAHVVQHDFHRKDGTHVARGRYDHLVPRAYLLNSESARGSCDAHIPWAPPGALLLGDRSPVLRLHALRTFPIGELLIVAEAGDPHAQPRSPHGCRRGRMRQKGKVTRDRCGRL